MMADVSEPRQDRGGDRVAMRAFLQRAETRLSTIHRVAGAFLGGAGVLALLPTLIKDSGKTVYVYFIELLVATPLEPAALLRHAWFASFGIVLLLPIAAVYYLVQDIVVFYVVARAHKTDADTVEINPRFSITAIGYPSDEPGWERNLHALYKADVREFLVPLSGAERTYFKDMGQGGGALPETRRLEALEARLPGAIRCEGRHIIFTEYDGERAVPAEDFAIVNTALGLASFNDRALGDEVARMEASLARHILRLRALVFRYSKAFLISIVAFVTTVLGANVIEAAALLTAKYPCARAPSPTCDGALFHVLTHPETQLSALLAVASVVLIAVVKMPGFWLRRLGPAHGAARDDSRDHEVRSFERLVVGCSLLSGLFAGLALAALAGLI